MMKTPSRSLIITIRTAVAFVAAASSVFLAACGGGAAHKVETGPGSVEYARRQLEGTWTLTKFEVLDGGQLRAIRAMAQLTYDAYGNLSIKGVLQEPLPGQTTITDAPALSYSGRAVIDAAKQELVLMGVNARVDPDPSIVAAVSMESRRKFVVTAKELVISAMDGSGRVTSRATYAKQ